MIITDYTEVTNRLKRLETEAKSFRRWAKFGQCSALFLFVTIACLAFTGASSPFDSFVLKDPVTKQRLIDMLTMNTGAAGFQVWDRKGTRRILLGTNHESQPGLTFWDSKGRQRILIGINNEDVPHISIWDTNEKRRIVVGLDEKNEPHITKFDQDGNTVQ